MKFFDLDADSTLSRIRASGRPPVVPSALSSLGRGALGFTLLGVAGFLPWVLGWGRQLGEGGMYAVCALFFVALSGPLLHSLIIGPGSLVRFYKLFLIAFTAYAIIWCAFWFGVKIPARDYLGIGIGCAAFATITAVAFGASRSALLATLILAGLHTAGYWVGAVIYAQQGNWVAEGLFGFTFTKRNAAIIARCAWGVFYGLGFGAGLGLVLHVCQTHLRTLIRSTEGATARTAQ